MIRYFFLALLTISSPLLALAENNKVIAYAQDTMANDFRKAQVYEVRDQISKHSNLVSYILMGRVRLH